MPVGQKPSQERRPPGEGENLCTPARREEPLDSGRSPVKSYALTTPLRVPAVPQQGRQEAWGSPRSGLHSADWAFSPQRVYTQGGDGDRDA